MSEESFTIDDLVQLVQATKEEFPYNDLYWRLRAYKLKMVRPQTVRMIQLCLALHKLGLPINTRILSYFCPENVTSTLAKLHRLGDAHILVLKRRPFQKSSDGQKKTRLTSKVHLEWAVHPTFLKTGA